ncbi:hypothetical protein [Sinomonas terrae]|uniref:Uncharacterized protein n=1 Tax=Sinomonas terrae TaxID=2908838 RepID=A0ABS9U6V9_9MICC|nr:hypothetical protein [Sinomonas terrae]MCH6472424.1 hypothetical protein [Sinomonas terrae]
MNTIPEHAEALLPAAPGDLSGPGDPLRVTGVVLSALPSDTLTPEGPQRYTVTASLSRRPDPLEVESIHSDATRRHLEQAGFGQAGLRLADRRLLISGTSLQELRNGLAAVVGTIVRTATLAALAQKELARQSRADLDEAERERILRVAEAAAAIDFGP